jgi:hypothetical protein
MDWLGITELVALTLVVLLLVPVLFLGVRRRWLSRQGGLFDCSVRLSTETPGTGWVLGVARYSGDNLEWFRAFSISLRPRMIFPRRTLHGGGHGRLVPHRPAQLAGVGSTRCPLPVTRPTLGTVPNSVHELLARIGDGS